MDKIGFFAVKEEEIVLEDVIIYNSDIPKSEVNSLENKYQRLVIQKKNYKKQITQLQNALMNSHFQFKKIYNQNINLEERLKEVNIQIENSMKEKKKNWFQRLFK